MKKVNVVVIESNLPNLELITEYITKAFAQDNEIKTNVKGFLDPEKAYEWIMQNGCNILFSDVELCGTDGLVLLRRIQQILPKTSIIITSSYEEYAVQALQMKIRLSGYLTPPFTESKIKDQLDDILCVMTNGEAI